MVTLKRSHQFAANGLARSIGAMIIMLQNLFESCNYTTSVSEKKNGRLRNIFCRDRCSTEESAKRFEDRI